MPEPEFDIGVPINAFVLLKTATLEPSKYKLTKLVQPEKATFRIRVHLGKLAIVKARQFINAVNPIVAHLGKDISAKARQAANADSSTLVHSGKSADVKREQ